MAVAGTVTEAVSVGVRERILAATTDLLARSGLDSVTTRAVSEAAGVQPPTIYRTFGDKQGLLDAAAAYGLAGYLERKARRRPSLDPVEDLRRGWDEHVELGLENPALYLLMYGEPRPDRRPPGAAEAYGVLAAKIHRVAEAGRLTVSEERAARLVHGSGHGTTLSLIAMPEGARDLKLSELAREAVLAAITSDDRPATGAGPVTAAVALRAALPRTSVLTGAEQALLAQWLDRIADADYG